MSDLPAAVADHFFNPRNIGDADSPSFKGRSASLICGAHVRFSIQIDEAQVVSQARFRAAGCTVLVASASLLTEQVTGKTTAEAAVVDLRGHLGCLEASREHCPKLACDALLEAIREYSDAAREEWIGDEALICTCFFVSERTIEREIASRGLTTVADVTRACNAGGGCGSCHPLIQEILDSTVTP
ncbi:MAG: iron-sulfur cluster assembly scaffold protein [Acidobacteria bacterium]|nr:iron-sulfur cluster assembly scaffold protein [Acidobacteriota bacterium]MCA1627594.1 iron-sulfur cluster assembly scaffold protein [Acidobacteriota bacterium]